MQVSNKCSLFAKRTSNRCTLLFPCPHALCTAYDEYVHVLSKLLCCGDIESNPGPDEWQKEVLTMLRELKAETGRLAQGQVDISANVATAQKSFEEKFVAMNTRILKIEAQCDKIDDVKERLNLAEEAVKTFEQTSTVMSSRLDDIEDRARRDNLIFHGIPDAKESWIQTEEKIVSLLTQHVDPNITDDVIERAHRLGGSYQENRCRPVIVKFSRFKLRQQVLFKRAKFKGINVSVTEDLSIATRVARKKLFEFANSLPQSPAFSVRHDKLYVGNTCYIYDRATDGILEKETRKTTTPVPNDSVTQDKPSGSRNGPAFSTRNRKINANSTHSSRSHK